MRILLEEVMLYFPGMVDTDLVRKLDLVESVLEQLQLLTIVQGRGSWCS